MKWKNDRSFIGSLRKLIGWARYDVRSETQRNP